MENTHFTPPPPPLGHFGEFHLFMNLNTNMQMENIPYTHPTTPPLPPPHTLEHFTIQFILGQLEHGDGAYTPNPTTPPTTLTPTTATPLATSQYNFLFSQLEHGDGDGT